MREMTKQLSLGLSLLGVLLSIVGFYVSNAPEFPLVQALVAPEHVSARAGINALKQNEELTPSSVGFLPLSEIIVTRVSKLNPAIPTHELVVERIKAGGGGIAMGQGTSRTIVGLRVHMSRVEKPWEWDLLELEQAVEREWDSRSLAWATWLFWIGIAQATWPQVVGTLFDRSTSTIASEPSNKTLKTDAG